MSKSKLDLPDDYDADPPVPIKTAGRVANSCTDRDNIPEKLFPEEHTTEAGDVKVIRSGWNCPQCDSNIFLHPDSIVPRNSVYCFNCSFAPLSLAWWEDARLNDILPED
jgi:hypothetical protein